MEENKRSFKSLIETTSNSSVYNKARKRYLEHSAKIRCSLCGYHRGENDTTKYYGTTRSWSGSGKVRFPSWKLSTKNRKQWYVKPTSFKIIEKSDYNCNFKYNYVEIKF